jgi:hypothetical protein
VEHHGIPPDGIDLIRLGNLENPGFGEIRAGKARHGARRGKRMVMFVGNTHQGKNRVFVDPGLFELDDFAYFRIAGVELFQVFDRAGKDSGRNRGTIIREGMAFAAR